MNEGPSILSGTWHSVYTYESTGRGILTDERDVDLHLSGSDVWVASLPVDQSELELNLIISGRTLTGPWRERTHPDGHYAGATFTEAVQFILAEDSRSMSGRWVGHSRDLSEVNTGTWS